MSTNSTPATFNAGEIVTALKLNTEIRDPLTGLQAAWDTWTPTLAGFTLGNGTLVAEYLRRGKTVDFRFAFVAGSSSTFTGSMTITLPFALKANVANGEVLAGAASMFDSSAGATSRTGGSVLAQTSTTVAFLADRVSGGVLTNLVPWTWAVGDTLSAAGTYQTA